MAHGYFPSRVLMTFSLCGMRGYQSFLVPQTCLVEPSCLCFTLVLQARLAPIARLPILAVWSFSCSLSLSLSLPSSSVVAARDLQHRTWRLRCVCRGQHHCTWRLSCCPREVGRRHVPDLAASHHMDHQCLSLHLWSHDSFLRNLDHLLKLFFIILT